MNFPRTKIKLIKKNGTVIEDVEGGVQPNIIFIDDASLPIEEGDEFERVLPNGLSEYFLVVERGYYDAFGSFPAHYQVKVEKKGSSKNKQNITNNFYQSNVNYGTVTSQNINIDSNEDIEKLFIELERVIKENKLDNEKTIIGEINKLKSNVGKNTYLEKYNNFIQSLVNHITIIAPFIPALTSLLMK